MQRLAGTSSKIEGVMEATAIILMAMLAPPSYFDWQAPELRSQIFHVDTATFCESVPDASWRGDRIDGETKTTCSIRTEDRCIIYIPRGAASDGLEFRYERAICNGWPGTWTDR